ncbi:MAG: hypothetical protein JWM36_2487 [Hyphomicrobiales bacterium]|nr:hypothetical protein [Hyphomicrobiales bacterium]
MREDSRIQRENAWRKSHANSLLQNGRRGTELYSDHVGPVPSSVFKRVHTAFMFSKWLAASGKSDAAHEEILAALQKKRSAWTMRDYHLAAQRLEDYIASKRGKTASSHLTGQFTGAGLTARVGRSAKTFTALQGERQSLADSILELIKQPTTTDTRKRLAFLQARLAIVSHEMRGFGPQSDKSAAAFAQALAKSSVSRMAQERTASISALLTTLQVSQAKASKSPLTSTEALRLREVKLKLGQYVSFGVPIGNFRVHLATFNAMLDKEVKKAIGVG